MIRLNSIVEVCIFSIPWYGGRGGGIQTKILDLWGEIGFEKNPTNIGLKIR
jgi:hypothetical protein